MFIRRLYYNLSGGSVIYNYSMEGSFEYVDSETEKILFFPDRDVLNIGSFEWLEPDEEIEMKMNGDYDVSVDVSVSPHKLVFTERVIPEPSDDDEISDSEALQIITEGETE